MSSARSLLLFAIAVADLGCGSAPREADGPKQPAPPASAKPAADAKPAFDFEALLRREISPLPVKKISGQSLSADVETSGEPRVTTEKGSLHLAIPIGTGATVDCYVYDEPRDAAATMALIVEEVRKSLEVRVFAPTDVFVAGEHPALVSHTIYATDQDGVKAAGEMKLAFYNSPAWSILCLHDEPGYSSTFKRVAKRFFETAKRSDKETPIATSTSWEVDITKLNGQAVGFGERRVYENATTHQSTSILISSALYPRSPSECRPQDSVTTRIGNASGEVLEYEHVSESGQEIEIKLALKRVSPASYTYTGEKSGKPISGSFKTTDKRGLTTDAFAASQIKNRLLNGKETSFKLPEYVANVDPTNPIEATFELESKEARRVRISYGSLKTTAIVDDDGWTKHVTANIGGVALTVERVAIGKR